MKFFGWLYLALLVAVQLIGWYGYGRPAVWKALMVIVVPSSILSGAAFFGFFYWIRASAALPLVLLMFIQIGVSSSSRYAPRSALLCHAMSEFLEKKVGSWEAYFGGTVLLCCMFLLGAVTAFATAEVYRLVTGREKRGGMALCREEGRSFARWDKKVAGGKDNEA
ncbi:MAG: hypothetical protein K9N47_03745 [Prosthecobacter sp.]|uniref:hypothetical protein n=1 Tax=Prosthecobacter sp. TaxID=1965333 RepID=UPI0025D7284A|nr:hypothetical protein [Prosthecobacter sp.]MCF7785208.1 hypothetical protein [Prosthecobacter sp.]